MKITTHIDTLDVVAALAAQATPDQVHIARAQIEMITAAMERHMPHEEFMDSVQALSALLAGMTGYDGDGAFIGSSIVAADEWQADISGS